LLLVQKRPAKFWTLLGQGVCTSTQAKPTPKPTTHIKRWRALHEREIQLQLGKKWRLGLAWEMDGAVERTVCGRDWMAGMSGRHLHQ
jgi:hypothetical protein